MKIQTKNQLLLLFFPLLSWFLLYLGTLSSMLNTWSTSDTFAHGFLILPISMYLIWKKRQLFNNTQKQPNNFFLIILLALSLLWMLAAVVDVQVIKQLTIILMLPVIVGALYGIQLLKSFSFPLFYLIFAVPFGEFLIPQLQYITVLITVWAIELTGVPVYLEGLYFSIPTGNFEVAVACSGIRYLIASLALGILYAYLTYQKLYKRLIFIAFSIIIPIIANGIRAYGIVMIAHLSEMKYATGVDHLIYGWLFFGIIIFILFYIGNFWRDEESISSIIIKEPADSLLNKKNTVSVFILTAMILFIMAIGPSFNYLINHIEPQANRVFHLNNSSVGKWTISTITQTNWTAVFEGHDKAIKRNYIHIDRQNDDTQSDEVISNYLVYYQQQSQKKELINQGNAPYILKENKLLAKKSYQFFVKNKKINSEVFQLLNQQNIHRLVIGWYYVFNQTMTNPIKIKIVQALGKITGLARDGYYIAYAIDYQQDAKNAEQTLLDFISIHWPNLRQDIQ